MGRRGTIVEYVSKMRSAAGAFYFLTHHSMARIHGYGYFISAQRRIETGPAGAGLEFRVRAKQLVSARGTEISSFAMIIPILVLVWRLCFRFTQDLKLARRKDLSPLGIVQCHLLCHRSRLDLSLDSSSLRVFREAEAKRKGAQQ